MAAYADAWLSDGSPLAVDAVTVSPYLGFGSLEPALSLAEETGRGVFVLAATSNPEGRSVQGAMLDRDGCVKAEPALAHARDKIVGGLLTPKDETGDCFKFTNALAKKA